MVGDELDSPLRRFVRIAVGPAQGQGSLAAIDVAESDAQTRCSKAAQSVQPVPVRAPGASLGASDSVKVLLVHGFCQNAKVFATRTSNLRSKALKAPGKLKLDCVFAESPLVVHDLLKPDDPDLDPRGWYNPREAFDGDASVRPVNSTSYCDWQAPLEGLRSFCQEQGPMSGVLAFSQGGVAAAALLLEQRATMKFGIFVSCFAALDPSVCALFSDVQSEPVDIPTMHVIGNTDAFVKEERSLQLARMFKNPVILYHDGGHIMIPKELFANVKEFLAKVLS